MSKFLKRCLAYLLIPAGVVLLLLPLNTYRVEEADKDFVFLEITETLAATETTEAAPSPAGDTLPDDLPEQLRERYKSLSQANPQVPTVTESPGYPVVQPEDLAAFEMLADEIDHMVTLTALWRQDRIGSRRLEDVPAEQWVAFVRNILSDPNAHAFQYGDHIFKGHVQADYASVEVQVTHLKTGCKITGGLFLLLSVVALYGLYTPPATGIQIGKRPAIIIWDVITLAIAIPFTWWFLDLVLVRLFQTRQAWPDQICVGMGLFWVILVNPIMALITTATSLQTLWITSESITVKGLFGRSTIAWSDVSGFDLSEVFAPRKVGGILTARKVTKVLEIHTGSFPLRILEPPLASTKKEILSALTQHAPQRFREPLSALSKDWLSMW